jgi:ketosteroid isomerase-like protein
VSDFESITSELRRLSDTPTAMSGRHLRAVAKQLEAIARGDFAAVLADATEDVTLEIFAPSELPLIRDAHGREALLAALTTNFAALEEQRPVLGKVFAEGDRVILFSRETGVVKSTGLHYDIEVMHWFTFRRERLASVQVTAAYARPVGVRVNQRSSDEPSDAAQ